MKVQTIITANSLQTAAAKVRDRGLRLRFALTLPVIAVISHILSPLPRHCDCGYRGFTAIYMTVSLSSISTAMVNMNVNGVGVGSATITIESKRYNNIVSYSFIWIRRTCDYI